jgi:hypothetical protein
MLGGRRLCHLKELLCATARGAQWTLEVLPESPRCAGSIAGIFEASEKGTQKSKSWCSVSSHFLLVCML